jgi:hypothetical protein
MRKMLLQAILTVAISVLIPTFARAGSATWDLNPGSDGWNTATNWTPNTVPNGPADTATFDISNTRGVVISEPHSDTEVNGIVFNAGASAFTIVVGFLDKSLTISGVGITNNSGTAQNFFVSTDGCRINFVNNATAGSETVFTVGGGVAYGGALYFMDNSTADHGAFTIQGGTSGGFMFFDNNSTAGHGTFAIEGGPGGPALGSEYNGGHMYFNGNSTAGDGTFIINGGAASGTFGAIRIFSTPPLPPMVR